MKIFIIGGVTCERSDPEYKGEVALLEQTCRPLGAALCAAGHTAVLCSLFPGSADLEVLRGMAAGVPRPGSLNVELHFPNTPDIRARVSEVATELGLDQLKLYPSLPPQTNAASGMLYAWLLAQLQALDAAHAVVTLGGKIDRAASLLLLLAEGRGKGIVPATFLGGAAQQCFYRRRYELTDKLGDGVENLHDPKRGRDFIALAERLAAPEELRVRSAGPLRFFISYARASPAEADFVEMLLRRRRMTVFRDETEFGAAEDIPQRIREEIHAADIFVALWSKEYACSPWCFDELELGLERNARGGLELWILCVDDTRMVPKGARRIVYYPVRTREEIEGRVVMLLERALQPPQRCDE